MQTILLCILVNVLYFSILSTGIDILMVYVLFLFFLQLNVILLYSPKYRKLKKQKEQDIHHENICYCGKFDG